MADILPAISLLKTTEACSEIHGACSSKFAWSKLLTDQAMRSIFVTRPVATHSATKISPFGVKQAS